MHDKHERACGPNGVWLGRTFAVALGYYVHNLRPTRLALSISASERLFHPQSEMKEAFGGGGEKAVGSARFRFSAATKNGSV